MATGLKRVEFRSSNLPTFTAEVREFLTPSPADFPEDFDAAARRYLEVMFEQPTTESFNEAETLFQAPSFEAGSETETTRLQPPDLNYQGTEEIPLTNTHVASYVQTFRGVPIYGSRIGVEMTPDKKLTGISGHVGRPENVDPVASLAPAEARRIVKKIAGLEEYETLEWGDAPQLMYRFNERENRWNLVYVFDQVAISESEPDLHDEAGGHEHFMNVYKIFIDAHNGQEVARIPLRKGFLATQTSGVDADGTEHQLTVTEIEPEKYILEDPGRKIRTMSMEFRDIRCGNLPLPGRPVVSESAIFEHASAVVAHANAARVYDFYQEVFQRSSIDGQGMWIVSSVDCLDYRYNRRFRLCGPADPNKKDYQNAAWIRVPGVNNAALSKGLMIYGQTEWSDGKLHSFAESLDVVGHELTHGITDYTSNLEYVTESGALNESYSDIIGVAISNADREDITAWDWELGEEVSADGTPTRDLADPTRFGQPDHMRDFRYLRPGERAGAGNDSGYVHTNSGIHNKAAYNLFTSGIFTWQEVAQMFYLTLTKPGTLVPRSTFADSKAGMIANCEILFQDAADRDARVDAVRQAFESVGV